MYAEHYDLRFAEEFDATASIAMLGSTTSVSNSGSICDLVSCVLSGSMKGTELLQASVGQSTARDALARAIRGRSQPNSIEETGIDFGQHVDLHLKTLRFGGRLAGGEIARRLKLSFKVTKDVLDFLKRERLIEVVGSSSLLEQQYLYVLSDKGYEKATEALERNQYVGPTPVPLRDYVEVAKSQSVRGATVTPDCVSRALSDLELSGSLREMIGAAVTGGHSILLYGKPGNGKSSIAKRITAMLGGNVLIPYAIDVGGQTIRVFDPRVHTPLVDFQDLNTHEVADPDGDFSSSGRLDQRWVASERPQIMVGGELNLADMDLKYSSQSKFYLAPMQMLANGGVLIIDDFGRQKMQPGELLNRWIVPMEDGVDHYSLLSGETIEVPFELLVVFSTNLRPEKLGDEAFWRRIRHKIEVADPDEGIYVEILKSVCAKHRMPCSAEGERYLIDRHYRQRGRPFRAVHPRDLVGLMFDMGRFRGSKPALTPEWIDAACASYFIDAEREDEA